MLYSLLGVCKRLGGISGNFSQTIQHSIPDSNLHSHGCKSLRSCNIYNTKQSHNTSVCYSILPLDIYCRILTLCTIVISVIMMFMLECDRSLGQATDFQQFQLWASVPVHGKIIT
jgi:hypothetical protein